MLTLSSQICHLNSTVSTRLRYGFVGYINSHDSATFIPELYLLLFLFAGQQQEDLALLPLIIFLKVIHLLYKR